MLKGKSDICEEGYSEGNKNRCLCAKKYSGGNLKNNDKKKHLGEVKFILMKIKLRRINIKILLLVIIIGLSNNSFAQLFDQDFFRLSEPNKSILLNEIDMRVYETSYSSNIDSIMFYSTRKIKVDELKHSINLEINLHSYGKGINNLIIFLAKKKDGILIDTSTIMKTNLYERKSHLSNSDSTYYDSINIPIRKGYNLYIYSPKFLLKEINIDSFLEKRKHDYSLEKILKSCRNKCSFSIENGSLKIRNGGRLCAETLVPVFTEVTIGNDIHIKGRMEGYRSGIPILIAHRINNVLKDTIILGQSSYCNSEDFENCGRFDVHVPINCHCNLYFFGNEGYFIGEFEIDKFLNILKNNKGSIKEYADKINLYE